ncbi:MAG TPA: hypothetical protein VGE46_03410, partial [Bdellovibrio sp.]
MRFLLSLALLGFLSAPAYAEKVETLQGKAFKGSNLVYTEDHTSRFSDQGRVLEASTIYKDASGKTIAEIRSDFSKSLSAPAHDFKDLRFKQRYGIRYEGDKVIMYVQEGEESEQTKVVPVDDKRALLVGCQGLAYYFRDNLEDLKKSKLVPILFLIPGKLETYNFELVYKNTDANGLAIFEIHIKNWLLRLFAPKLTLHYDTIKSRLVKYEGLS